MKTMFLFSIRVNEFNRVPGAVGVRGDGGVFVGEWVDGEPEREWRGIIASTEIVVSRLGISFFACELVALVVIDSLLIINKFSVWSIMYVLYRLAVCFGYPTCGTKMVAVVIIYIFFCKILFAILFKNSEQYVLLGKYVEMLQYNRIALIIKLGERITVGCCRRQRVAQPLLMIKRIIVFIV